MENDDQIDDLVGDHCSVFEQPQPGGGHDPIVPAEPGPHLRTGHREPVEQLPLDDAMDILIRRRSEDRTALDPVRDVPQRASDLLGFRLLEDAGAGQCA